MNGTGQFGTNWDSARTWLFAGTAIVGYEMIDVTSFGDTTRSYIKGLSNERREETVFEIPAKNQRCLYCGRKAHSQDATCDGCGAPL